MKGLYIHIPFCAKKCDYCDFYSLNYNSDLIENYVEALCKQLINTTDVFDTVYFGGGTPSIIGYKNLSKILSFAKFKTNAEITIECNPKTVNDLFFEKINESGFNRVSIGLQSSNENELSFLTRNHSLIDVENAIISSQKAGIDNVSLDVMIGLCNQTIESIKKTLDFCINMNVKHISSYMLKIEQGTPFSKQKLSLPDDDTVSDMYLFMCEYLEKNDYYQYEISNFSKTGFQSRHNLIYWNCDEYLGLGPAAHSYYNGKRYYYPRNIDYFINGGKMLFDQNGGDIEEYLMLKLRLTEGICFEELNKKGFRLSENFEKSLYPLVKGGFLIYNNKKMHLTKKGFLVQNSVLTKILEAL